MIIENDALNMKLASDLLHAEGYQTMQAPGGRNAEALVEARRPHLILMDMWLSGRSGIEVARSLKSNPNSRPIPIIILTPSAQYESLEMFMQSGCDDYLSKPISIGHFHEKIRMHLTNSQTLPV